MVGIIIILGIILLVPAPVGIDDAKMKQRRLYCCMVFGAMFLFAALRGASVGIDNANRNVIYTELCSLKYDDAWEFLIRENGKEYGYTAVIWLISRIIPVPYVINLFFDIFVVSSFSFFFYKHAQDIKIAALMYFSFSFSASLNITRQYVACAFFLWAIECLLNDKIVGSVVLIAIAVLFHTSGIILLLIYILYFCKFNITRKGLISVALIAVCAFFTFDEVSQYLVNTFFPQYQGYLWTKWAVGSNEFSFLWLAIYSLILLGLLLCVRKSGHDEKKDAGLILQAAEKTKCEKMFCITSVLYVIYALIGILTSKVWFLSRMKTFFCVGFYFAVGDVFLWLPKLKTRDKALLRVLFIAGMSVWAVRMFKTDGNGLFPYQFFWE